MSANPIDQRIGTRLRQVRNTLGLSLEAVKDKVGFSNYQTLSDIETAKRPAKASELAQLCELYCKDTWYFLREDEPQEMPLVCAWRDARDSDNKLLVEAQVYRLARYYQLLEELTEETHSLRHGPWPMTHERLTFEIVANKAEELVRDLKLGARPSASLWQALEVDCHIKVLHYELQGVGSAMTAIGEFGWLIAVDSRQVPWRRNFSLAHELFHLLSHNYYPLAEIHSEGAERTKSQAKPRYEVLADVFAATLLMPSEQIINQLNKRIVDNKITWSDLIGIATHFDVSTEALLWRLVSLKRLQKECVIELLQSNEFRAHAETGRQKERRHPALFSRRFAELGIKALRRGRISKGRFCQIFDITRAEFTGFVSLYGDFQYTDDNTGMQVNEVSLIPPPDLAVGFHGV